MILNKQIN